MADVKRTVKGQKTMAKGSIPGKHAVHPHTAKAMNAVAIGTGLGKKGHNTGNGLGGADTRY